MKKNNPQHTPGPWTNCTEDHRDDHQRCFIRPVSDKYNFFIAKVLTDEADAQLIAAAPQLLRMCKRAFTYIESSLCRKLNDRQSILDDLLKAIEEAEGKK